MNKFMATAALAAVVFSITSMLALTGSSDTTLDQSNCCGTGPFGTVTVTQNGANELDFSVSLNSAYQFIGNQATSGGHDASFAFATDTVVAINAITSSGYGTSFTPSWFAVDGYPTALDMDGAHHFSYGVTFAGNGSSDPGGNLLTFNITNVAGLTLSDLIPGFIVTGPHTTSSGIFFAADITTGCTFSGSTLTCGPTTGVVWSSPNVVPLPAALPLFATGLGTLGLLGWRRKRKNAVALAA